MNSFLAKDTFLDFLIISPFDFVSLRPFLSFFSYPFLLLHFLHFLLILLLHISSQSFIRCFFLYFFSILFRFILFFSPRLSEISRIFFLFLPERWKERKKEGIFKKVNKNSIFFQFSPFSLFSSLFSIIFLLFKLFFFHFRFLFFYLFVFLFG